MNNEERLKSYIEIVDTKVARRRIATLLDIASSFYPEAIEDLFVSEHREKDGRQIIRSVWLFSDSYTMEFKNPLQETEETFDLAIIKDLVVWFEASKKDFDFENATADSRLTVKFTLASRITGELFATGGNCLILLRIVKERLFPNIGIGLTGGLAARMIRGEHPL